MENKVSKIVAVFVIISGIIVLFGWFFNITFLKSISPNWVSMKFITAVCFVLSGVILFLSARCNEKETDWEDLLLIFSIFVLILIVGELIISILFNIRTGLENLFVSEEIGAKFTVAPGRPAIVTLINFVAIAMGGLINLLKKDYCLRVSHYGGMALMIIDSVAILGYIINVPLLYYYVVNFNTAMAFNTAVLFTVLGFGFFSIRKRG